MWPIEHTDEFDKWLVNIDELAVKAVLKSVLILEEFGPNLGRPYVDTLKQSKFKNMKELRVQNKNRVYRIFFAFDPQKTGVLLIAADKKGIKNFYKKMIPIADEIYTQHLKRLGKKK